MDRRRLERGADSEGRQFDLRVEVAGQEIADSIPRVPAPTQRWIGRDDDACLEVSGGSGALEPHAAELAEPM